MIGERLKQLRLARDLSLNSRAEYFRISVLSHILTLDFLNGEITLV